MLWIGDLGNLAPVKCPASEDRTHTRPTTIEYTLAGVPKAQVGRRTTRSWSVDVRTATPTDVGVLYEYAHGQTRPLVFVPAAAQVTNLLTPSQSLLRRGSAVGVSWVMVDGPVALADGAVTSRSAVCSDPTQYLWIVPVTGPFVPVRAGAKITVSAYLAAATGVPSPRAAVGWVNYLGQQIGSTVFTTMGGAAMARKSATLTPPTGAAGMWLAFQYASRVARPAVTWTDKATPWGTGGGAPSVLVTDLADAPLRASPTQQYQNTGFTIQEVGSAAG